MTDAAAAARALREELRDMAWPIVADALRLAAGLDPRVPVRGAVLVTEPFATAEAERHHVPVHVAVTFAAHGGSLAETVARVCTPTDLLVVGHHCHGGAPGHLEHDAVVALSIARGPVAVVPEMREAHLSGTKVPVAAEADVVG